MTKEIEKRVMEKIEKTCKCGCGKPVNKSYVSGHNPTKSKIAFAQKGKEHPRWKTGRTKTEEGYVLVYCHGHPRQKKDGRVFEHILVAEKKLDRYLKDDEVVHHLNSKPDDNRPENLIVLTKSQHSILHNTERWKVERARKKTIEECKKESMKSRLREAVDSITSGKCKLCDRYRDNFAKSPHLNIIKCPYHEGIDEGYSIAVQEMKESVKVAEIKYFIRSKDALSRFDALLTAFKQNLDQMVKKK